MFCVTEVNMCFLCKNVCINTQTKAKVLVEMLAEAANRVFLSTVK